MWLSDRMLMNECLQEVAEQDEFKAVDRECLTLAKIKCSCFKPIVDR